MITVLADQYHYQLGKFLHPTVQLERYDPMAGWSDDQIRRADALLIRSTTPLSKKTLPDNNKLRFVGTASAGRDHIDEDYLQKLNIHVADAKGSNAKCVAEYIAIAVLSFCESYQLRIDSLTAGIVGAGWTGSATADLLESLGLTCRRYDPPREIHEQKFFENKRSQKINPSPPDHLFRSVTLEELLSSDLITFHVPLVRTGPFATFQWYNETKIRFSPKRLVINAARGGIVDEHALCKACHNGHVTGFICDVWKDEPHFNDATAMAAYLATPHIAGYSVEAKREATRMICNHLHQFFDLPNIEPKKDNPLSTVITKNNPSLAQVLERLHPAFNYDRALQLLIGQPAEQKGAGFFKLRQDLPLRHEFHEIQIPESLITQHPVLEKLGFRVSGES
ncbi:MAG: NAD(P)-dependent oxidoreductase [Balneolales bacterium]